MPAHVNGTVSYCDGRDVCYTSLDISHVGVFQLCNASLTIASSIPIKSAREEQLSDGA